MKISARNQLKGTVKSIETGSVNAIVHIDIGNGNVISSTISIDAVKELGLAVGKEAYAIIKATSVMLNNLNRLFRILNNRALKCGYFFVFFLSNLFIPLLIKCILFLTKMK